MAYEFKAVHRVAFAETDMAGLVHFSNYFRFMEIAEHGFFRSLGFSVVARKNDPAVGWPRVHASCDYSEPIHFEDEIEIQLLIAKKKSKALTYVFKMRKLNCSPTKEVARGTITVVCVKRQANGKMVATKIPKKIADKIEIAPVDLLK